MSIDLFLNHINQHYKMLRDEELIKIAFRFGIQFDGAIAIVISNGWQEEILKGGQKRYWHPDIKDRNSLIKISDFRNYKDSNTIIDIRREGD